MDTSRRGFLRLLGSATAAGVALPVIDKLDFMARQPTTVLPAGRVTILGDWYVAIDSQTRTISLVNPPPSGITIQQLYSAVVDRFDDFEMMAFPNPMLPVTPNMYTMENDWHITKANMRHLREGSLRDGDDWWMSRQEIGAIMAGEMPERMAPLRFADHPQQTAPGVAEQVIRDMKPTGFLDEQGKISWVTRLLEAV